jgi:hypothetical protein
MYTYGPGNISTSLLCVPETPTFRGKNIRIDLQESLIGDISPGAFGPNNPVAVVSADAIVDGFIMDGGMTPRTADGWTLNEDYPLIQLTGIPNYGVVGTPTQISKGRVKLCNATISAPYSSASAGASTVVLIGDLGQGSGVASTPNGFFELENVNIDGYRNGAWTATTDTKHMVSNIQFGSKIHGCSFTDGEQSGWNTIINCVDANDVQVFDNSFLLTGIDNCENIILGIVSALGVRNMMINDNNIAFEGLDATGPLQGAVTLLGATECTVCNNTIHNTSPVAPPGGLPIIHLSFGTTNCVATGNTICTGDGAVLNIPILDFSWLGPGAPPPTNLWNHYHNFGFFGIFPFPPAPLSIVTGFYGGPVSYDLNIVL